MNYVMSIAKQDNIPTVIEIAYCATNFYHNSTMSYMRLKLQFAPLYLTQRDHWHSGYRSLDPRMIGYGNWPHHWLTAGSFRVDVNLCATIN